MVVIVSFILNGSQYSRNFCARSFTLGSLHLVVAVVKVDSGQIVAATVV